MEKAIEIKRRAQRCIQNGDLDGALAEYEKLVGFEDSDPYNYVLLADLLYKKGEQADAAERYLSAVASYEKATLYKNAIAVCKKMTRLSLSPAKVLHALANLHALDGLSGEAALYYVQYAEHMVRSGSPADAAQALRRAFDVCQDNVRVLEQLSEAWLLAGDQQRAAQALVEATNHYRQRGQEPDANRCAKRAATLDASVPDDSSGGAPAASPSRAIRLERGPAPAPEVPERAVADLVEAAQDLPGPPPSQELEIEPTARVSMMMPRPDFAAPRAVEGFDSGRHEAAPDTAGVDGPDGGEGPGPRSPGASPADFAVTEAELEGAGSPAPGPSGNGEGDPAEDPDAEVQFVIDEESLSAGMALPAMEAADDEEPGGEPIYEITIDEDEPSPYAIDPDEAAAAFEDEPGAGDEHVLVIDDQPEAGSEGDAAAADEPEAGNEHVLVIEDEPFSTGRTAAGHDATPGGPAPAAHGAPGYEPVTTSAPGLTFGSPAADRPPPPAHAAPARHAGPTTQELGLQQVEALLTQAQEQFRAGDRETASTTLARAAQAYEVLGRFDSAATIYRSLGRSASVPQAVLELWLVNCERRGDLKEAATVACEMGDRALNGGDEPDAKRWFERAVVFDAQNETARRRLQRLAGGGAAAAGPVAVASAPGTPVMEAGRVEVAVGRGEAVTFDLSGLLSEFQRGVEAQLAGDAQSHYDLGMTYREMGLLEQAVDSFRVSVGEPRLAARAMEMIGRCHADQGRWAEAVGEFRRALQQPAPEGGDAELRFHFAHALVELGETEEALAEYERVAEQLPGHEDVDDRIAALRRVLGRG